MPNCSAYNCTNRTGSGRSFQLFPHTKPDLLQQWIKNVRRQDWKPRKWSVLCSDHFPEDSFDKTGQTIRLKEGAMPTKFNFPKHLIKEAKSRKPPKLREVESLSNEDMNEGTQDQETGVIAINWDQIQSEHSYASSRKRKFHQLLEKYEKSRKRLKTSEQKVRRLKKKISNLSDVIMDLKRQKFIATEKADILEKSLPAVPKEIMKRIMSSKGKITRDKYSPYMRSFALTLQFYSTKAYNYVRRTFGLCLPHPDVLRRWYSHINCEPGFCEEAFNAVKMKVEGSGGKDYNVICGLILDEISIRKHVQWDGKRFRGYIDMGTEIDDDDIPLATEALVLMVVAYNGSWKIPIAYFFINGLAGSELANLVNYALKRLFEIQVIIPSVTFDGPSCHFRAAKCLGANLTLPDPQTWFPHPSDSSLKVYVVLDACHMLKLVRNVWASQRRFIDVNEHVVDWKYVEALHNLQEKEGLRMGTRLTQQHLDWHRQKMKVRLAAQTLSSSVADAIEFCCDVLKLQEFAGCEATVNFIRHFDRLFDLLNSRSQFSKGFKAPMKKINQSFWQPFVEYSLQYIKGLVNKNGIPMYLTKCKTGFAGFYVTTLSIVGIYEELVAPTVPRLNYLLTYKVSQDHLELFFSAVRARGGWNNNPTVQQFISAFKRLLIRHELNEIKGNAEAQDKTKILSVPSTIVCYNSAPDALDHSLARRFDLELRSPAKYDHDYVDVPNNIILSEYSENVVAYIAGFVVRSIERQLTCQTCISALHNNGASSSCLDLIFMKQRGGLTVPSKDTIAVCLLTEKCIRRMLNTCKSIPKQSKIGTTIEMVVLKETYDKFSHIFSSLDTHMLDSGPESNHSFRLVKLIAKCYVNIRFFSLGKRETYKGIGEPVRSTYSRLIIFKNQ